MSLDVAGLVFYNVENAALKSFFIEDKVVNYFADARVVFFKVFDDWSAYQ